MTTVSPRSIFRLPATFGAAAMILATAWLLMAPGTSFAQETSSDVRGVVTDASGVPLANATVTVRNEATGLTRSVQTSADGGFTVRSLPIGSDYTVVAELEGYGGERIENLAVNLGSTATVRLQMGSGGAMDEITVVGSRGPVEQVAVGPSATFGLEDLQTAPAINRNITDVLRTDPRIYVDESRGDINAVQCGGKNSRFNSLTVDGVRLNDAFGLNSNGYPTERMPFSFDAVNQVSVELAPFDVEYGGFSACNINAVIKSGGNDFSGSAFVDYTSDSLRGDSLEGDDIESGAFNERRYGVTIGGPIVQDKLFFFAAYEKLEGANLFDRGPIGSGAVNEVNVTQAQLDEIVQIANDLYQYDPGSIPSSFDNEDEKLLLKFDWNISDQHRAAVTYTYNDGFNITESDGDSNELEFSNHLYERGAELNSYVANLYSDWTDNFSTEVRFGYLELDNRQNSIGGNDFGEIRIDTGDVDVYIGGDDSRQANVLNYDVTTLALKGNYFLADHSLTFGYERESLEVFNLFVQHVDTEIRFNSIDNFRNGLADRIDYNNAPSGDPNDAAADWGYDVNTLYLQDEFGIGDRLTVVAGVRYDWYETSDEPPVNPDFLADYGFGNNATLDGAGLVQPRVGFTFDWTDETVVRGGVGLYSGGNPNVWLSNNYSANNVQQFGQRGRSFCYTPSFRGDCGTPPVQISLFDPGVVYGQLEPGVPAGPGYGVPQELIDAVAAGVGDNFEINYLDPDFELPSEWKFALGMTHIFPGDYVFSADYLFTRAQDSAIVLRGDLEQTGTTPEGYPIYTSAREASFVLTNSDQNPESHTLAFSLSKEYLNGFDFRVGYAYNDAEDVNPMTSSVAISNYSNRAFFDPQEDIASTSNYNIEHRFTFTARMRKAFWADYLTTVSLFGSANSGRPFSVTVDPTSVYGFTPFIDNEFAVLPPGAERNGETGSWWRKLDLLVEQELPGFGSDHRASAFLVIDNFTNFLNDDWGILRQHAFPRTIESGAAEPRLGDASRYEVRFGLRYAF